MSGKRWNASIYVGYNNKIVGDLARFRIAMAANSLQSHSCCSESTRVARLQLVWSISSLLVIWLMWPIASGLRRPCYTSLASELPTSRPELRALEGRIRTRFDDEFFER